MDPRHWDTLELPKILERLASYTSFSAGSEKARSLAPSPLLAEVQERLQVTTEARALLAARPHTSLGGARDVRPQVSLAQRGGVLTPAELLDVRGTLLAAHSLQQSLARLERQFPLLADIARRIAPCPELVQAIGRCIDERGEVRDEASPQLARIRQELRLAHDRLLARLQRLISSPETSAFVQEPIITLREGRYVIPLKADFKGRIHGIVHDRSASGATLFIEPLSVVDLNNTWRELQMQEAQEIQRILADLSARVALCGAPIEHTVDALADLDLALAKARYAQALEAVAPTVLPGQDHTPSTSRSPGHSGISLLQARHPLLDPATVVPIDVVLDPETHVLVITGPNTGGKTVTLKTVGLLVLMVQAGLHLPVASGSALPVFEAVYADIGDEQSIEQSLSTFSSHLTNVLSFIGRVDGRSLVLLDELGAGTDPAEGSALARALLEAFRQKGATVLVATHYPELKAYAQLTPGVKNACMEFDPQTLRPTYHLTIGLPGRSNAFAIARRLGLADEIVRQAEALVSQEDRQTEGLLADLHRLRLEAVRARDEAEDARTQARHLAAELHQRLAQIEKERASILEQARQNAAEQLQRFQEEIHRLRQRLQIAGASLETLAEVEEELAACQETTEGLGAEPPSEPGLRLHLPARPARVGDAVWVKPLSAVGTVLTVDRQEAEVRVGPVRVRLDLDQLEPRPPSETTEMEEVEPAGPGYQVSSTPPRLDLRGNAVEEALERLERHLQAASLSGLPWVLIVHGKGTGALRQAVREFLHGHPLVASYRAGVEGEGGDGVTVACLV